MGLSAELFAAVGTAAVLVLAVLVVLVRRRGKKKRAPVAAQPAQIPPETAESSPGGIYVRLEVLRGAYAGPGEFTLAKGLLVGRDAACDIAFDDPAISRRNSRVFLAGGVVYLEDLGSQNGTFLNGARLEMASILRSGDEIALGDTAFRLKF